MEYICHEVPSSRERYLSILEVLKDHTNSFSSRFAVRNGKKSPNQETGMDNKEHLKVPNDAKLVQNEHE